MNWPVLPWCIVGWLSVALWKYDPIGVVGGIVFGLIVCWITGGERKERL